MIILAIVHRARKDCLYIYQENANVQIPTSGITIKRFALSALNSAFNAITITSQNVIPVILTAYFARITQFTLIALAGVSTNFMRGMELVLNVIKPAKPALILIIIHALAVFKAIFLEECA